MSSLAFRIPVSLFLVLLLVACGGRPSIQFLGKTWKHVETNKNYKVINYSYTVDGKVLARSPAFVQITDFTDPAITPRQVEIIRVQIMKTLGVRPLNKEKTRYFGYFRNGQPMYVVQKGRYFIIYSDATGKKADRASLRQGAEDILDSMELVSTE